MLESVLNPQLLPRHAVSEMPLLGGGPDPVGEVEGGEQAVVMETREGQGTFSTVCCKSRTLILLRTSGYHSYLSVASWYAASFSQGVCTLALVYLLAV